MKVGSLLKKLLFISVVVVVGLLRWPVPDPLFRSGCTLIAGAVLVSDGTFHTKAGRVATVLLATAGLVALSLFAWKVL